MPRRRATGSSQPGLRNLGSPVEGGENLLVGREVVGFSLRPDLPAVDGHLERPTGSRDQSEFLHPALFLFEDLGRQTDGPVGVVSGNAVLDLDLHKQSLAKSAADPPTWAGPNIPPSLEPNEAPPRDPGPGSRPGWPPPPRPGDEAAPPHDDAPPRPRSHPRRR